MSCARRLAALGLSLALGLGLLGCATRAPRPQAAPAEPTLAPAHALQLISAWQRSLADYIERAGDGDPAVLARLPALRATGSLRPMRIGFGLLDLDAHVAEADGFDVQGLLLPTPQRPGQLFMVGIVQRRGYRPLALAELRVVTMQAHDGRIDWQVGDSDAQALARYRAGIDRSVPLRFPADQDDFALVPCGTRLCVAERHSQARWPLPHAAQ